MRSSAAYLSQLQALLPPGAAWPRDEDAVLTRTLAAFADEFARVDARALALLEEADPLSALELLEDWERAVGLPDDCAPGGGAIRERQLAIARKLASLGGQSRATFVDLAALLGLEVEIDEFAPFAAGRPAGTPVYNLAWRFAFAVRTLPPSLSSLATSVFTVENFAAGRSQAGDPLRAFGSADLECLINRAKPAHTEALFVYEVDPEPLLWFDFTAGTVTDPDPLLWFDFA